MVVDVFKLYYTQIIKDVFKTEVLRSIRYLIILAETEGFEPSEPY